MYICSICKTPTPREDHCDCCGWVKTLVVKEEKLFVGISSAKGNDKIEEGGYLLVTKI